MLAIDSACQMRAFKPWLRADWCMPPLHEICWHWLLCHMETVAVGRCWHQAEHQLQCVLRCRFSVTHGLKVAVSVASHHCVGMSQPAAMPWLLCLYCWHSWCIPYLMDCRSLRTLSQMPVKCAHLPAKSVHKSHCCISRTGEQICIGVKTVYCPPADVSKHYIGLCRRRVPGKLSVRSRQLVLHLTSHHWLSVHGCCTPT